MRFQVHLQICSILSYLKYTKPHVFRKRAVLHFHPFYMIGTLYRPSSSYKAIEGRRSEYIHLHISGIVIQINLIERCLIDKAGYTFSLKGPQEMEKSPPARHFTKPLFL